MTIGHKIKSLRVEKGVSQTELAGTSMSRSLICRIENGSVKPSLRSLAIIAQHLNVSMEYFLEEPLTIDSLEILHAITRLFESGRYDEAVNTGEFAITRRISASLQYENQIKMIMGKALYRLQKVHEAIPYFDDVYENCRGEAHLPLKISAIFWSANCYYHLGQYDLAYRKYNRVVEKSRNRKSLTEIFYKASGYQATSALRLGRIGESLEIYKSLFVEIDERVSPKDKVDVGLGLCWAYHKNGETELALSTSEHILNISLRFNGYQLAKINNNMAIFLNGLGHHQKAVELWERSLREFMQSGSMLNQAVVLEELAHFYLQSGNFNEAEQYARRGLDIIDASTKSLQHGRLCRVMGNIARETRNVENAHMWYQLSIEIFRSCNASLETSETLKLSEDLNHSNIHR